MKTPKFIYAAMFSIALFSTTTLSAQESQKTIEDVVKASTDKLDEKLELSDEQETKVYNISLKYAKKSQELKNSSASRREKYKTFQANNDAKATEMKTVLTEEQFKEWQIITEEQQKQMRENRNK